MSRRLKLALFLSAVLCAVLTAAPSFAASGRISIAEGAPAAFPDHVLVLTLPKNQALTTGQVHVLENGQPVNELSVVPASAASPNQFGVVLVIDTSNSMAGKPIDSAFQAAQLFVGHRAPTQQLALVTFNRTAQVALPFTTDTAKIVQALAHRPTLAYGTHIYDAVAKSVALLQEAKITAGSIVVLSDGADTGSVASIAAAEQGARDARVRIYTVGLKSGTFQRGPLENLATAGAGGFTLANSVDELSQIYDQLGTQLSHQYLVHYRSLQGLGRKVRITVRVDGIVGTARSGYATPTLPPPVFRTYHRDVGDSFWGSPFTMIVFSVFAVGFLALGAVVLLRPRRRTLQRRLAEFISLPQASDGQKIGALATPTADEPETTVEASTMWKRFVAECELAEIEMSPSRIAIAALGAMVIFMWIVAVFFTFAALMLGFLIPLGVWGFIRRKVEHKRSQFAEQLPDNLAVLSSALRAGHSFVGALSVVVNDAPEPAKSEFQRVVADEQLGRPLDEALDVVVERMNNRDLGQVALVAALQRETGGSTAEVLDRVVETVRERQELRRLVKTLTAAGRMSRWVVSALPLVLLLAIWLLNPGYLHPLFAHTTGRILFVFAAVLVVSGSLVIKRIVDIKV